MVASKHLGLDGASGSGKNGKSNGRLEIIWKQCFLVAWDEGPQAVSQNNIGKYLSFPASGYHILSLTVRVVQAVSASAVCTLQKSCVYLVLDHQVVRVEGLPC